MRQSRQESQLTVVHAAAGMVVNPYDSSVVILMRMKPLAAQSLSEIAVTEFE
ncbi:MAG: hypothetical protein WD066_14735 [Planctomycetaceae bacterium]